MPVADGAELEDASRRGIIQQIRDVCEEYEEFESCHTVATIPQKKLRNAREAFGIAKDAKIIMVYDGTVFGSNKLGFAICEGGIYWKNDWTTSTKRTFLTWEEFREREIRPNVEGFYIGLGRGDNIAILLDEQVLPLGELLKKVRAILRGEGDE